MSTVNVAFLPIYLTQDRGFFKDEGLDVLVVMFNAGATNLQAVIGDAGIIATIEQETETGRLTGKISAGEMIDQGFINLMAKSGR